MRSPHSILSPMPFAGVLLALGTACADAPVAPVGNLPDNTPVSSVQVDAPATTIVLGQSLQLTATPRAADGRPLSGRVVAWASSDSAVATVSTNGLVQASGLGSVTITATAAGVDGQAQVFVNPVAGFVIELNAAEVELDEGAAMQLVATVRNEFGNVVQDAAVEWTSLHPTVATVVSGRLAAVREGETVIRVRYETAVRDLPVRVRAELGGHLLFVSTDGVAGGPRIYRTDLLDKPTSIAPWPASVFGRNPQVSPDGQRVAYTCASNGSAICVADVDGSNARVLTDAGDAWYEDEPAWSPDGARIAFRRWEGGWGNPGWTKPTDIWVMDADGGNEVDLTNDPSSQHQPRWSPVAVDDAYRIAFVEDEIVNGFRQSRIGTMRADGADRRFETVHAPKLELTPTWSPDGTQLLFSRQPLGAHAELRLLDLASGAERALLPQPLAGGQAWPAWSPNGQYIAFSSAHETGHDWQVYTIRADGARLTRRTSGGAGRSQLAWIPLP